MRSDGCHSMRVAAAPVDRMTGRDGLRALGSSKQGGKREEESIKAAP